MNMEDAMRTDDIAQAFRAIVEEAEKIDTSDMPAGVQQGLATIVSIAKHQKDTRNAAKGSCKAKQAG
jgi:hypothetical protein